MDGYASLFARSPPLATLVLTTRAMAVLLTRVLGAAVQTAPTTLAAATTHWNLPRYGSLGASSSLTDDAMSIHRWAGGALTNVVNAWLTQIAGGVFLMGMGGVLFVSGEVW